MCYGKIKTVFYLFFKKLFRKTSDNKKKSEEFTNEYNLFAVLKSSNIGKKSL